MATVTLTREAGRQLDELPNTIHQRVLRVLERLQDWPKVSGTKALSGPLAGKYRIRTGDYRVQFHVAGEKVTVEKIGHRDGFYGD